jgi:cytochrome P450/NADPH-cytochrome P450 reductase
MRINSKEFRPDVYFLPQFFTCGSGIVAKGIKASLVEVIKLSQSVDTDEATVRFEKVTKGRYATDIFD